jgi:hypothetical protein
MNSELKQVQKIRNITVNVILAEMMMLTDAVKIVHFASSQLIRLLAVEEIEPLFDDETLAILTKALEKLHEFTCPGVDNPALTIARFITFVNEISEELNNGGSL